MSRFPACCLAIWDGYAIDYWTNRFLCRARNRVDLKPRESLESWNPTWYTARENFLIWLFVYFYDW